MPNVVVVTVTATGLVFPFVSLTVSVHVPAATAVTVNVVAGVVDRTRPLCSYPASAHYVGTGSTDEAQNFRCQAP